VGEFGWWREGGGRGGVSCGVGGERWVGKEGERLISERITLLGPTTEGMTFLMNLQFRFNSGGNWKLL